jgi:hypothetical protein
MRRIAFLFSAAVAAAVFAGVAAADAVYHTSRIPLQPVTAATPGEGMVVNIHTNGPVIYAHEIYTLQGAVPGSYEVVLHIDATSLDCSSPTLVLPTATMQTNAAGNARADATFTPEQADGLRGHTVSAFWTISGPATYRSSCNLITLD